MEVGVMAVPETAMDKYGYTILFQNYVGASGQPFKILPIAIATTVQVFSND